MAPKKKKKPTQKAKDLAKVLVNTQISVNVNAPGERTSPSPGGA